MDLVSLLPALDEAARRRVALLGVMGGLLSTLASASPIRPGIVAGQSMSPTLESGQPFLYRSEKPGMPAVRRGEVVLVKIGGLVCVKRVLAVGGDHFWAIGQSKDLMTCHILTVNTPIAPWKKSYPLFKHQRVTVPQGHLFVVGDGCSSLDSRQHGSVPTSNVIGRVLLSETDGEEKLTLSAWRGAPRRKPRPGSYSHS